MTTLTEREEAKLEKDHELTITREGIDYDVDIKNTLCYGDVDFSEDSSDLEVLYKQHWVPITSDSGKILPVFDYHRGLIKKEDGVLKTFETWSSIEIAKYGHCQLGKPNKVLIFKTNPKRKYRK